MLPETAASIDFKPFQGKLKPPIDKYFLSIGGIDLAESSSPLRGAPPVALLAYYSARLMLTHRLTPVLSGSSTSTRKKTNQTHGATCKHVP
jgi:hypothetical protein